MVPRRSSDKTPNRIKLLCSGQFSNKIDIDPVLIAQKVCTEIHDGVKTSKSDELTSDHLLYQCIQRT